MGQSFRDLRIWQNGYQNLLEVYKLTASYPQVEKFALAQDTRRSANSVIANIAESHGRYFYADKIRVLYIARGEIEETRSHLLVARGLDYFQDSVLQKIDAAYEGLAIGINSFIADIQTKKPIQHSKR